MEEDFDDISFLDQDKLKKQEEKLRREDLLQHRQSEVARAVAVNPFPISCKSPNKHSGFLRTHIAPCSWT